MTGLTAPVSHRPPEHEARALLRFERGDGRWIGSSLAWAMRRAQLCGIVLVQIVLMVAALASELVVPAVSVFAVAGIVVLAGVAVLALHAHALVLIVPYYLALAFYHIVAVSPDDPLLGALVPLTSWTIILPIMLRTGAWPVIVSGVLTLLCTGTILIAHPDWDPSAMRASLVTNTILVVAATCFMQALRGIAASLDRQKQEMADQELDAARQRAAKEANTEYVRVLHDTIVNTFGALARDDAGRVDPVDARERCRRDLERIRAFQRSNRRRLSLTDLEDIGLPVRWSGISGDDLRRYQALLPVAVLDALYGCASEAILNATKHSGASEVVVDARYVDDELRVTIIDAGVGFDRSRVAERGIAGSLLGRAEAQGIAVALETAPGAGTTVRLSCSPGGTAGKEATTIAPADPVRPLRAFILGMALAWAAHAVVVGVALELVGPQGLTLPAYGLLVMLLLFTGAVRVSLRGDRAAPRWLIALMLAAVPVANWCALSTVDYGRDAPYLFQAMSLTVLPVLLHVSGRTFAPFLVSVGLQIASMLALGLAVFDAGAERWTQTALLEAPTFALLAVWYLFLRMFRDIGAEIADSHRNMERARRDAAENEAAAEIQLQWSASALRTPFQLLAEIADGTISPSDPGTRRRCGLEEAFLRQISGLPHTATTMSRWFALALAEARKGQIRLELQAENAQIHDERSAEALGRLLIDCIEGSPERSALTVTFLHRDGGTRMLIVGSGDGELAAHAQRHDGPRVRVATEQLADRLLVEATLAAA